MIMQRIEIYVTFECYFPKHVKFKKLVRTLLI